MRFHWPLALALASCSGPVDSGPEKPGPSEHVKGTLAPTVTIDLTLQTHVHDVVFAYARKQVWDALLSVHTDSGLGLSQADEENGVLVYQLQERNRRIAGRAASEYVDCGMTATGARVDTYRLNLRLTHQIESAGEDMTRMRTQLRVTAAHPGTSSDVIECSSTGQLEKRIVGFVAAALN
jgi:hypothetical protein